MRIDGGLGIGVANATLEDEMMLPDGDEREHFGYRFEKHEPCPECQKAGRDHAGNNLGRYADGHGYCFSCHYFEKVDINGKLMVAILDKAHNRSNVKDRIISLPPDSQKTIDVKGLRWLHKYGIIRDEIIANDIRWNSFRNWLVFPYKDDMGRLLAWQARSFNENDPKWRTEGAVSDLLHLLGKEDKPVPGAPIVIVEDIISAIKIARQARALPLFGSHVGLKKLLRLKYLTHKLVFWLDSDKYPDAIGHAQRAELMGLETQIIYSEKDPKDYEDDEIRNTLYTT